MTIALSTLVDNLKLVSYWELLKLQQFKLNSQFKKLPTQTLSAHVDNCFSKQISTVCQVILDTIGDNSCIWIDLWLKLPEFEIFLNSSNKVLKNLYLQIENRLQLLVELSELNWSELKLTRFWKTCISRLRTSYNC